MIFYQRSNVSNAMSVDPKDLWATLPPALQRQIVDDIAAVLAEMSHEVRTGQTGHLSRKAVVYIRQSTPHQVVSNQESLRLQYALRQRARELGWHEADIDVIDADLGMSGASITQRSGFKELVGRVGLSEVG